MALSDMRDFHNGSSQHISVMQASGFCSNIVSHGNNLNMHEIGFSGEAYSVPLTCMISSMSISPVTSPASMAVAIRYFSVMLSSSKSLTDAKKY